LKGALRREPVIDPAGWTSAEMERSGDWLYRLNDAEVADLDRAVAVIEDGGLPLIDVRREHFPLSVLGTVLDAMRAELVNGRGFVLIRGVPVHRYTRLQSAIAFWGIGTYLGEPTSQNAEGHLLGHVIDTAGAPDDPATRGYYTAKMLPFHCDGVVDTVGLLCLQAAKSGGASAVCSTVTLYNTMLERRPDLVAALSEPLYRDRKDEVPPGAEPYYLLPVFTFYDGHLSTCYGNITSAQRFPELPRLSPLVIEALQMFDEFAHELCLTMEFQQGDIQLLNNHVIAHSRISAVEDYPEPERKRHLLRLRLMTPGGRPLSPAFFAFENIAPDRIPNRRHSGSILGPRTVLSVPLEP
jgi:hypothetical protein